jgi:hypothetical protein
MKKRSFCRSPLLALLLIVLTSGTYVANAFDPTFTKGLSFIENIGQVTDQYGIPRTDIDFKVPASEGLNIFITKGKLYYQWSGVSPAAPDITRQGVVGDVHMYRLDVALVGASPSPGISTEWPQSYQERYYLPQFGAGGKVARSYKKVIYHNVYPNIDWIFYINPDGKLEHDFLVREGGNVADIRLEYKGASRLGMDTDGSLQVAAPMGLIREKAPVAFIAGENRRIKTSFQLNGNILSFKVDPYKGDLLIDPTIEWSTYYGGTLYDMVNGVVVNKDNHAYAVGATSSTANIATTGSHQAIFGGGSSAIGADAMLLKFAQDGTCIWATYYGGTGVDAGYSIAVDTMGFIYLAGQTNSQSSIGTPATHRPVPASLIQNKDAFLVKFDTSGQRIWGTYFGGDATDGELTTALACDAAGGIYLGSRTESNTGIATSGAFQAVKSTGISPVDGFLAKFNSTGNLDWATYYGGSNAESIYSITVDTIGNIYMGGATGSTSGIATPGVFQGTFGGETDGFVAKFSPAGQRIWGTYIGGINNDQVWHLIASGDGYIYGTGTTSNTGIATAGSHQPNYGGGPQDGFLVKFDYTGQRDWATYYGGTMSDVGNGLFEGIDGSIYLLGSTVSANNIASPQALQPALNGNQFDLMLVSFQPDGTRNWGTYLGGNLSDIGTGISGDRYGNLYLGGQTNSLNGLATPGAHQQALGGDYDGLLYMINTCEQLAAPAIIAGPTPVCEGALATYNAPAVPGAGYYNWILPPGWSGNSTVNSIDITVGVQSGSVGIAAVNGCGSSDTTYLAVTVKPAPDPVIQRNGNTLSVTQLFNTYQWNRNGLPVSGANGATYLAIENGSYTLTVTGNNGCSGTSAAIVVDNITGIEEALREAGIRIYPNPAHDRLHIRLPFRARLVLYTLTGRKLLSEDYPEGESTIKLPPAAQGMYMLLIQDKEGRLIGAQKIIQQ